MSTSACNMQCTTATNTSKVATSSRRESLVRCLDESLLHLDDFMVETNKKSGMDHNNDASTVIENIHSISYLPPLDQITICSDEGCGSDTSSIGDVSTTDMMEDTAKRPQECTSNTNTTKNALSQTKSTITLRTIFDRYWEKNPVIHLAVPESKVLLHDSYKTKDDASSTASVDTYERCMTKETDVPRRRIFHNVSVSSSAAAAGFIHDDPFRFRHGGTHKVHSDSSLFKKKPSCLRRSRFSLSSSASSVSQMEDQLSPPKSDSFRRSSVTSCTVSCATDVGIGSSSGDNATSSSSIVTFNPKVDVVVFRKPVEHFAAKGWSEYFLS